MAPVAELNSPPPTLSAKSAAVFLSPPPTTANAPVAALPEPPPITAPDPPAALLLDPPPITFGGPPNAPGSSLNACDPFTWSSSGWLSVVPRKSIPAVVPALPASSHASPPPPAGPAGPCGPSAPVAPIRPIGPWTDQNRCDSFCLQSVKSLTIRVCLFLTQALITPVAEALTPPPASPVYCIVRTRGLPSSHSGPAKSPASSPSSFTNPTTTRLPNSSPNCKEREHDV